MSFFTATLDSLIGISTFGAAIYVAYQTQNIANSADKLTATSNTIALQANRIEAEKMLICWGQRVTSKVSEMIELRLLSEDDFLAYPDTNNPDTKNSDTSKAFYDRRRQIRSQFYALAAEGQILLTGAPNPALAALNRLGEFSKNLKPPQGDDYDSMRKGDVTKLRDLQTEFVRKMQQQLELDWLHGAKHR